MSAQGTPSAQGPGDPFKDDFVLMDLRHVRVSRPEDALTPTQVHQEVSLGEEIGRIHIDCYTNAARTALYARFYVVRTGAVAWFRIIENEGRSMLP